MGVKGLTTYIATKADQYLRPLELHDTCLVIDGDSLATNLYQWSADLNSAFGGDYPKYHQIVVRFFAGLHKCGIRSFVLLDGGYQQRKLRTVHQRLRSKIASIRHCNPLGGNHLFPLQMREAFVDAVRASSGAQLMRCTFEADDEVAQLARQLRCPVLSYDSDFYIHNVRYIPSVSLTHRPIYRGAPRRNRRKPAATSAAATAAFRPYWYLDCAVYSLDALTKGAIRPEVVPLFAVLLGNDYVGRQLFAKFFANVSTKGVGRRNSPQQRRIIGLLRWLRGETLASAWRKVVGSVEAGSRVRVERDMRRAMEGYVRASSEAFGFFGLGEADRMPADGRLGEVEAEVEDEEEEAEEEEKEEAEEQEMEDEQNSDEEPEAEATSDSDSDSASSSTAAADHDTGPFQLRAAASDLDCPAWLRPLIAEARVPRFVIDMMALRTYINSPQVQDVKARDCNEAARSLVAIIYTAVHLPRDQEAMAAVPELTYLTRGSRNAATFVYEKIAAVRDEATLQLLASGLEGEATPQKRLDVLLGVLFRPEQAALVADQLPKLAASERLVAVGLAYAQASALLQPSHLHTIVLSMLALSGGAAAGCSFLDEADFNRQHRGYVTEWERKQKLVKQEQKLALSIEQKQQGSAPISRHEAILLWRNLLPMLQPHKNLRSKLTSFSVATVHKFAEWQAIVFHLNTLNTLLAEPLQRIQPAQLFHGSMAYSLQTSLANRPDMLHYIRTYLLADCPLMAAKYGGLLEVLAPIVQGLGAVGQKKKTRNLRKLEKKRAARRAEGEAKEVVGQSGGADGEKAADEHGYDGLGSRFAGLAL